MTEMPPIILFAYNRPMYLQKTLDALAANENAKNFTIYFYCDGPKIDEDPSKVTAVREICRNETRFHKHDCVFHEYNKGLASSIIDGVTEVLNKYDSAIILEDDLVTAPGFLNYMSEALSVYSDEERVASIHGFCLPVDGLPETFFLRGADCWGWGVWRRSWKYFEPDAGYLFQEIKKQGLKSEFNVLDSYPYYTMLKNQKNGKINSWAIRWHASCFLKNQLTLYPGKSLVQHIGVDDATHRVQDEYKFLHGKYYIQNVDVQKISVEESIGVRNKLSQYLKANSPGVWKRVVARIARIIQ